MDNNNSELYRQIRKNLDEHPVYKDGTPVRELLRRSPPKGNVSIKAQLQKEVTVKDYTRLLLVWMSTNPKKKKGLKIEELENALDLKLTKPKTGALKEAIENVLITKEEKGTYRLPKPDIIEYLIDQYNANEIKLQNIFDRKPVLIQT